MGKKNCFTLIVNFVIILLIMLFACTDMNHVKGSTENKYELIRRISEISIMIIPDTKIIEGTNEEEIEVLEIEPEPFYDIELTENEKYELAKIAMAEAEDLDIKTKTLVIMVVLNRVKSNKFPDSISEVILQNNGKVYQFSPVMPGGRWYKVEPNADCYEAVEVVLDTEYDYSEGALFFEDCKNEDNWHSRNLTFLYKSCGMRFYK